MCLLVALGCLAPMLLSERVRNLAPASTSPAALQLELPPPSDTAAGSIDELEFEFPGSLAPDNILGGQFESTEEHLPEGLPPLPDLTADEFLPEVEAEIVKPVNEDGLVEFLSRWEMNDLIFMFVQENLRPTVQGRPAWFVLTPNDWRQSTKDQLQAASSLGGWRGAIT